MDDQHLIALGLVVAGNALHLLKKVVELRQSGLIDMGLKSYVTKRPYLTAFGFGSSVAVALVMGVTDPATALLTGFTADSAMDAVGRKSVS